MKGRTEVLGNINGRMVESQRERRKAEGNLKEGQPIL
jgi:hypothetical protein